jgi:hypothetical protein
MGASEQFDGGDRVVSKECDAKPTFLFLLRVEIILAKNKISKNDDPSVYSPCIFRFNFTWIHHHSEKRIWPGVLLIKKSRPFSETAKHEQLVTN